MMDDDNGLNGSMENDGECSHEVAFRENWLELNLRVEGSKITIEGEYEGTPYSIEFALKGENLRNTGLGEHSLERILQSSLWDKVIPALRIITGSGPGPSSGNQNLRNLLLEQNESSGAASSLPARRQEPIPKDVGPITQLSTLYNDLSLPKRIGLWFIGLGLTAGLAVLGYGELTTQREIAKQLRKEQTIEYHLNRKLDSTFLQDYATGKGLTILETILEINILDRFESIFGPEKAKKVIAFYEFAKENGISIKAFEGVPDIENVSLKQYKDLFEYANEYVPHSNVSIVAAYCAKRGYDLEHTKLWIDILREANAALNIQTSLDNHRGTLDKLFSGIHINDGTMEQITMGQLTMEQLVGTIKYQFNMAWNPNVNMTVGDKNKNELTSQLLVWSAIDDYFFDPGGGISNKSFLGYVINKELTTPKQN